MCYVFVYPGISYCADSMCIANILAFVIVLVLVVISKPIQGIVNKMLSLISALYHVLACFMIIVIGFISFIYVIIDNSVSFKYLVS